MKTIVEQLQKLLGNETFVKDYFWSYKYHTGKILTSVEELVCALTSGEISAQDMFEERLNHIGLDDEIGEYWEDNMERYMFDQYVVGDKDVGDGAWIKVFTENGYEVHYAKKSRRKIRFFEEMNKVTRDMKRESNLEKIEEFNNRFKHYQVLYAIGLIPYEVFYYRTKTQKKYLNPIDYELVDIDDIVNMVYTNFPFIKVRSLFTSVNKDAIFYLRSRGIPERIAKIMSNLKQCYFKVDMNSAIEEYNRQLASSYELVES